jgi:hypothetical protein
VAIDVSGDGTDAWPSMSETILRGTPPAIITEAAEWRSVCKPTEFGNPARLAATLKARRALRGSHGSPNSDEHKAGLMPSRAGPETLLSLLCTHGAESPHGNLRERHGALKLCRLWLGDRISSGVRATVFIGASSVSQESVCIGWIAGATAASGLVGGGSAGWTWPTIRTPSGQPLQLRIGIDTGPVVAGVIRRQKIQLRPKGRHSQHCEPYGISGIAGHIQVTDRTYQRLRDHYRLEPRGLIQVKSEGAITTYILVGRAG